MAETDIQQVKSKKELLNERLKNKYPDKDFEDEEALYGQISDDYDSYDNQISGYQDREKKFTDMFTADPRSAHFLTSWSNGDDPVVTLVRQFGTDIKDAIDDPERLEQIAEANKEYVERVAREKELEGEYQTNLQESLQYLDTFQEENGLSDDEVDDVMEYLLGIVKDGIMGKFSPESIDMARKALNHDVDVEEASNEGEVRGKNAKISEQLRKKSKGDGLASLDGKNGGSGNARPMPSLGALDNFGDNNQTIWERGGEKRRKASY